MSSPLLLEGREITLGTFSVDLEMSIASNSALTTPEAEGGKGNFHIDREEARAMGFPDCIVAGPHMLTIVSEQLTRTFGVGFLRGGELAVNFRRPVLLDQLVAIKGTPTTVGDGTATLELVGVSEAGDVHFTGSARVPYDPERPAHPA